VIRHNHFFLAVLVLLGALLFFYRDVVFGGRTFLIEGSFNSGTMPLPLSGPYGYDGPRQPVYWDAGAIANEMEPWQRYIGKTYQAGAIPLWNPHQGLGVPLHANGNAGVFDPLQFIIYLAPSQLWPLAVDIHILMRFYLAGLFTYLLLRAIGLRWLAAVSGALIYMLSNYFAQSGNISFIRLETLLPMLVYVYHRLVNKRTYTSFLLVVITIFLFIAGDFPEILALALGIGFAWYCLQTLLVGSPVRHWRSTVLRLATGALASVAGILLGAFILLPFVQFLSLGFHVHDPELIDNFLLIWSPATVVNYVTGTLFALVRISNGAILFCIVGAVTIWRSRKRRELEKLPVYSAVFLLVTLFILLVTYRVSIFSIFAELPIANMIFWSHYAQAPVTFFTACGAGIGLEIALRQLRAADWRSSRRIMITALGTFIIFVLVALLVDMFTNPLGKPYALRTLGWMGLISVVFAGSLFVSRTRNVRLVAIAATCMFFFEAVVATPLNRPARMDPYNEPPFVTYLHTVDEPFRIVGVDGVLRPNVSTAYGLDDLRYEDAINPNALNRLREQFLTSLDPEKKQIPLLRLDNAVHFDGVTAQPIFGPLMDMFNVRYILTADTPERAAEYGARFELVHESAGVSVYRNNNALPRAYIVHSAEVLGSETEVFNRLSADGFDPRRVIFLQSSPPTNIMQALTNVPTSASESAAYSQLSPNDVQIEAHLDSVGFLVVSNLDYPGWEALVDGTPARIYNGNSVMQAIPLPEGSHKITLQYRSTTLMAGLFIAGATALLLTLFGLYRAVTRTVKYNQNP